LVNREDFTPYGETSFGSFAKKRYRYTGKERDEESGLYYHGARYCVPWLGRWTSADSAGFVDGPNLYCYVSDNPVKFTDPSGTEVKSGWFFQHEGLGSFFKEGTKAGLPVAFLDYVLRDWSYNLSTTSGDSKTDVNLNIIRINANKLKAIQTEKAIVNFGRESKAIDDLYHEFTHAYVDIVEPEDLEIAEKYYTGKYLKGGGRVTDAWGVAREAATGYVGHRAEVWANTFRQLNWVEKETRSEKNRSDPKAMDILMDTARKARADYNSEMQERVFGYEVQDGEQIRATAPIPSFLKDYLDKNILEGKIPDNFDKAEPLRRQLDNITLAHAQVLYPDAHPIR